MNLGIPNKNARLRLLIYLISTAGYGIELGAASREFFGIKVPDWINVMAFTKDQKVILVEQYRYGIQAPTLELPGGVCDPGEHP